jgi:hypothetical protein
VDEEQGIYREEVSLMLWKLADIDLNVERILNYLEGDDGEEEEDSAADA